MHKIRNKPVKQARIAPNHWAMAIIGEKMAMPRNIRTDPWIV